MLSSYTYDNLMLSSYTYDNLIFLHLLQSYLPTPMIMLSSYIYDNLIFLHLSQSYLRWRSGIRRTERYVGKYFLPEVG